MIRSFISLLALGVGALAACSGSQHLSEPPCSSIPGCQSACCNAAHLCLEEVCDGLLWVCSSGPDGTYAWAKNGPRCSRPDAWPADQDGSRSDGPGSCGANATQTSTGCQCKRGYVNQDGSWSNGCELVDPACSVISCGKCPDGYCGQNAHCRYDTKCRCINESWRNADNDWKNGCEAATTNCTPTSCNNCYVGYCGPHADCMQNKCACIDSAWKNCNGSWQYSGCECNGTCVGSQCQ